MNLIARGTRRLLLYIASRIQALSDAENAWLCEENRLLRQALGDRRPRLTDVDRVRLATLARSLPRRVLERVVHIVRPDTVLRWQRVLIDRKEVRRRRRDGGRRRELVLRFAAENPTWGCRRIQGALANLGIAIGYRTVARILREDGLEHPPARASSWRSLIKAQAAVMAASDFFTAEVWTGRGLVTHFVLFAIDLGTRAVEILGVTTRPDAAFVEAVARGLVDPERGFLRGKRKFVIDRDKKFTKGFRDTLEAAGVEVVRTAWRAPNMNAYAERFVRTIKQECLQRLVLIGQRSLHRALREYVAHYNCERNHQGLGNRLICGGGPPTVPVARIATRRRLGGLLNFYHDAAAA